MLHKLNQAAEESRQRLVLWGLVCSTFGLFPAAYAVYLSNSVVLLADLLRCFTEWLAIVFSWFVLHRIGREDRSTYNFGLGKLEHLACLAVAGALLVTCFIAVIIGVRRFLYPEPVQNSEFGLVLAILSVLGNGFLWAKNYLHNVKSPSLVVDAQRRLFRAKTYATLVVTFSLGVTYFDDANIWSYYLDPVGSIFLAGFMFYSAYAMASSSVPDLIDRAAEEEVQLVIMDALIKFESHYVTLENVRTRRSGVRLFVDIFLTFDRAFQFSEVQTTVDRIKSGLEDKLPGAEIVLVPSAIDKQVRLSSL